MNTWYNSNGVKCNPKACACFTVSTMLAINCIYLCLEEHPQIAVRLVYSLTRNKMNTPVLSLHRRQADIYHECRSQNLFQCQRSKPGHALSGQVCAFHHHPKGRQWQITHRNWNLISHLIVVWLLETYWSSWILVFTSVIIGIIANSHITVPKATRWLYLITHAVHYTRAEGATMQS